MSTCADSTEAVSATEKRDALLETIDTHLSTVLGEDFQAYDVPTHEHLQIRSNLDNLALLRNGTGVVRALHVYWLGPAAGTGAPDGEGRGLMTRGNRQRGMQDAFRVAIHYEYADDGSSYDPFADLLTGTDPEGLIRFLNRAPAIETNAGATLILSRCTAITVPTVPKPLKSSSQSSLRAHHATFNITLTDNP